MCRTFQTSFAQWTKVFPGATAGNRAAILKNDAPPAANRPLAAGNRGVRVGNEVLLAGNAGVTAGNRRLSAGNRAAILRGNRDFGEAD